MAEDKKDEKAKVRVQMPRDLKTEMEIALEFHRAKGDPQFAEETLGQVMKRRGIEMIKAAEKYGDDYEKFRREFLEGKRRKVEGLEEEDERD